MTTTMVKLGFVALLVVAVSLERSSGQIGGSGLSFSAASQSFCGVSSYKEACLGSLGSLASKGGNTNPRDLIQASFQSTFKQVSGSLQFSVQMSSNSSGAQKMWMEDCSELLQSAVEELQECVSVVGVAQIPSIQERQTQLLNWLSAVISYQQTCLDGIFDSKLKDDFMAKGGLSAANQLTSNALALVSAMSSIFSAFKMPNGAAGFIPQGGHIGGLGGFGFGANAGVGFGIGTHNSLGFFQKGQAQEESHHEEDAGIGGGGGGGEGYPSWFSGRDRKLFESNKNVGMKPNAVVAKDGSGQFKSIGEALAAYPPKPLQGGARYVIYVKAGIYDEYLTVTKKQVNVFIYGDGPRKTIITGRKNFHEGVSTFRTATFSAIGEGFIAKSIGFRNTAGPEGHQAVALRVQSDMSAFYNCRMDGYQDTLYVQAHRQFYRNCIISGTVDFIFGDAAAVIQNCLIIVRKPGEGQKNAVTAQGRVDQHETTGIVIQNSKIVPEKKLYAERAKFPTYLGRPWKQFSRTVIMESQIDDLIRPEGWLEWEGDFALNTLYYAEYANSGAGAATDKRVKWKGYRVLTDRNEALQFTPGAFLQGNMWLTKTGAPYTLGLKR